MQIRFQSSKIGFFCALGLLLCAGMPVMAQSGKYNPPRTADGKPNLNGIWQAMNSADWDLQAHGSGPSLKVDCGALCAEPGGAGVVEGQIPYLPAAVAKKEENRKQMDQDPEVRCYLPGVPRATYVPYPFEIVQGPNSFAIVYEYDEAYRKVFLKDPGEAPSDTWMGQSYGKWEGDTFVVDVTGLNGMSWLDRVGDYDSNQLHVVERYTLTGPTTMNYEATIIDPKVYSQPWKISMPLYKHVEKNARLTEFKCVEYVEELVYGQYRKKK